MAPINRKHSSFVWLFLLLVMAAGVSLFLLRKNTPFQMFSSTSSVTPNASGTGFSGTPPANSPFTSTSAVDETEHGFSDEPEGSSSELSPTPTPTPSLTATASPTHAAYPPQAKGVTPTPGASAISAPTKEGYSLVLNESFSGSQLNTELWNTQFAWGDTNPPELEKYTASALTVQPGNLRITAARNLSGPLPYSSGVITSRDRFYFQYGYIEFRAKIPKGQGLWPALWLLAEDKNSANEIDVMEVLGHEPNVVNTTIHFKTGGVRGKIGTGTTGLDFSQDFHTYALDWEWNSITWFIDGRQVFQVIDHVPQEPMYILANLAVGGVWPGYPDQTTQFPAYFDIQYIRVFVR